MQGDLTVLANVKGWAEAALAGQNVTVSDVLLSRLISGASSFILNVMNRDTLAVHTVAETYDGFGSETMMLRQWPVLSVQSISFCGTSITTAAAGNPRSNGFLLEPPPASGGEQKVTLFGYRFPRGSSLVDVVYTAGFQTTETQTIDADKPMSTYRTWLADTGVAFVGGAALIKVDSSPAAGHYAIDPTSNAYLYNVADDAKKVALTYSYVPFDIEQACVELVGEWFKRKDRIGLVSHSTGAGQTTSFSQRDMTPAVKAMLQPYCRVMPG